MGFENRSGQVNYWSHQSAGIGIGIAININKVKFIPGGYLVRKTQVPNAFRTLQLMCKNLQIDIQSEQCLELAAIQLVPRRNFQFGNKLNLRRF